MQHKVGVISDIVEEARQRGGDMFQYLNRISDAIVDAAPEPRAGAERAVYADFDPSKHLVTREDMTVIGLDKLAQSLCDQALAHGYVLEYKLTRGAVQTSGESPHTAQPFPEWLERAEAEATRKAKP
jgi:hypothetical protein